MPKIFPGTRKPMHRAPTTLATIQKNAQRGAPLETSLHRYAASPKYGKSKTISSKMSY